VARRFGVSVSYVVKARLRRRRLGTDTPGAQRSHTPRRLAEVHESIRAHVQQHPDATLNELRAWLQAVHGVLPSMGLMWNTLDRLGLTLKKGPCTPPNRPAPISLNPERLVFIDETWTKTNMTRLRGRAPRGQRLLAKVPHGHVWTSGNRGQEREALIVLRSGRCRSAFRTWEAAR
jgi:transposase